MGTMTWSASCQTEVYLYVNFNDLKQESFRGGWDADTHLTPGWDTYLTGVGSQFRTQYNSKTNKLNIVFNQTVPAGISEISWDMMDSWVGGLFFCTDQSGPCAETETCTNSEDMTSHTCTAN